MKLPMRSSALVAAVAGGQLTESEDMGHREFILTYKSFRPSGPGCFPAQRPDRRGTHVDPATWGARPLRSPQPV